MVGRPASQVWSAKDLVSHLTSESCSAGTWSTAPPHRSCSTNGPKECYGPTLGTLFLVTRQASLDINHMEAFIFVMVMLSLDFYLVISFGLDLFIFFMNLMPLSEGGCMIVPNYTMLAILCYFAILDNEYYGYADIINGLSCHSHGIYRVFAIYPIHLVNSWHRTIENGKSGFIY